MKNSIILFFLKIKRIYTWSLSFIILAIVLCFFVGLAVNKVVLSLYLNSLRTSTAQRLDFYGMSLDTTLNRNDSLPKLIALEATLTDLLMKPQSADRKKSANNYLAKVKKDADIAAAYLMSDAGLTLAASNAGQQGSFVGNNYSFRPYFLEAMHGRLGRFYGIGATTGEPGFFLAAPILKNGHSIGVAAVKVSLNSFESALFKGGDTILLVDASGVVFLTSVNSWKYQTLTQLDQETELQLRSSRQYHSHHLRPMGTSLRLQQSPLIMTIAMPNGQPRDFLVQSKKVGHLGWTMILLSDYKQEKQGALLAGIAAGFAMAFLLSIITYFRLYAKQYKERRLAEAALRRVHLDLEKRIEERTAKLVTTNMSLEDKIETLKKTESILSETSDNAVQAGKLAVLGQMSAGISHELNQPLTALHTFTDNAVSLLERGRLHDLQKNLGLIRQMADRMGNIVSEIKTFARKAPSERQKIRIADAISQALMMAEPQRKQIGAVISISPFSQELLVWGDLMRLEQILLNLLRNALDAIADTADKYVVMDVQREEQDVRIVIKDSGLGISDTALPRLFEPFFTTKPVGQGLGLGLAISRMIITELGGKLYARNSDNAGAEFTIVLEVA